VRTTCRSWDKGVLTDLCLTGVLTDLCLTLYCVLHGILLLYVERYVTLSLIQHRMHSHSISHISLQMQRKFNYKYRDTSANGWPC